MKTAHPNLSHPVSTESFSFKLWTMYRTRPEFAIPAFLAFTAIFAYCTVTEPGFLPSLPAAIGVFMTVYNLIDQTTRLFDAKRRVLGFCLGIFSVGASMTAAFTGLIIVLMLIYTSW